MKSMPVGKITELQIYGIVINHNHNHTEIKPSSYVHKLI